MPRDILDISSNKSNPYQRDLFSQLKSYLRELYRYRWLTITVAYSELQNSVIRYPMRYLWWFLEPLLLLLCYVFLIKVLGRGGPRNGVPFPLFIFVGILPWFWTIKCISGASTLVSKYSGPISQIRFPILTLIFALFIYQTLLFLASLVVLVSVLLAFSYWPNVNWLYWPLIFFVHSLLILTILPPVTAFSVFVPDISKFLPFILRLWFYGSPILWDMDMAKSHLSPALKTLFICNPISFIFTSYRDILLYNKSPDIHSLLCWLLVLIFLAALSMIFFINKEKSFARFL